MKHLTRRVKGDRKVEKGVFLFKFEGSYKLEANYLGSPII